MKGERFGGSAAPNARDCKRRGLQKASNVLPNNSPSATQDFHRKSSKNQRVLLSAAEGSGRKGVKIVGNVSTQTSRRLRSKERHCCGGALKNDFYILISDLVMHDGAHPVSEPAAIWRHAGSG